MTRTTRRTRRAATLATVLALASLAAACGQRPGVHDAASEGLPEIIIETAGGAGPGGGAGAGDGGDGPATGAGGGASGGQGGATGGGTGGGAGDEGGGAGDGQAPTGGAGLELSGSDTTGVSDDTIRLGVHAPVTGAAPLPSTSFEQARDLYWRYVTEMQGEQVLGRSRVEVEFRDDKYTPNTAIQVCRELAASVFMLVGGGGTDQIQACGRYADQAGVPYLSAGVTENDLTERQYYFATSMSYRAQTDLLAQYLNANHPNARVAAVVTDTPNFDDAVSGWESAVERHGLDYFRTLRHPKGNTAWINSYASDLRGAGVDVVFMLTSPTDYIQFAQQAGTQGYRPQYVGVGITMGLNAVLDSGCPDVNGGVWFSPFPGLDWARQNEPAIFEAGRRFGIAVDDLGLALWGLAKVQHQAFQRYEQTYGSTNLTREDFVRMLEQQQAIQTGLNPQLSYSPDDHFGSSQVHVLRANCNSGEHVTVATFASGF